jgi:hypothetical protein
MAARRVADHSRLAELAPDTQLTHILDHGTDDATILY